MSAAAVRAMVSRHSFVEPAMWGVRMILGASKIGLAGSGGELPAVRLSSAGVFCAELHDRRDELREAGADLPVWDGELYLELHRGTYTTQAWLKRANRRAEQRLRAAEWLAFWGAADPGGPMSLRSASLMGQRLRSRSLRYGSPASRGSSSSPNAPRRVS